MLNFIWWNHITQRRRIQSEKWKPSAQVKLCTTQNVMKLTWDFNKIQSVQCTMRLHFAVATQRRKQISWQLLLLLLNTCLGISGRIYYGISVALSAHFKNDYLLTVQSRSRLTLASENCCWNECVGHKLQPSHRIVIISGIVILLICRGTKAKMRKVNSSTESSLVGKRKFHCDAAAGIS